MRRFSRLFKVSAILLVVVVLATFSTIALAAPEASGPGVPPPPKKIDSIPNGGVFNLPYLFLAPWSIFFPIGM